MLLGLCCFAVCFQSAYLCPVKKSLRSASPAYLDECTQTGSGSERWSIKMDFALAPGGIKVDFPLDPRMASWTLPTPEDGFWLKSAHLLLTNKDETVRYAWPPVHVHHLVCRSPHPDTWYDKDVFHHQEIFLSSAGSSFMNEHSKRYDLVNEISENGHSWAAYTPAHTKISCGLRVDDDRFEGETQHYKLVINLDLVIDEDRVSDFRPMSFFFWEGTTTGQIGYNTPAGPLRVFSKEYEAPMAGSFHPDSFDTHTHPGGKSIKLIAKRLGGNDFTTPQLLLTLQHANMTVKSKSESRMMNVKPGVYMRAPTMEWSEMGLKWLGMQCAFQKGDIFYLEADHDSQEPMRNTMNAFAGLVLWSDTPQATPVGHLSFRFSGVLRNQLFNEFSVPYDVLTRVPQRVNQSVLYWLHSEMPSLFCHPDRVADIKSIECVRKGMAQLMFKTRLVEDIHKGKARQIQKQCGL